MKRICVALAALTAVLLPLLSMAGRPAEAAVTSLTVSQSCSAATPGLVRVEFAWSGADASAVQQWLDLSLQNNGWVDGTYLGAGPFAAGTAGFAWDNLIPGALHFVRVNQQLPDGTWDPSPAFAFTTRSDCALALPQTGGPPAVGSVTTGASGGATGTITVVINTGLPPGGLVPFPGGAGGGATTPGPGCLPTTPVVCITSE